MDGGGGQDRGWLPSKEPIEKPTLLSPLNNSPLKPWQALGLTKCGQVTMGVST